MKLAIALVYLFYCSLTTGIKVPPAWPAPQSSYNTYVAYPHTNNRHHTHALQQPQKESLFYNPQKQTDDVFDPFKQPPTNNFFESTLPPLQQQQRGFALNSYPFQEVVPSVVPTARQSNTWVPLVPKQTLVSYQNDAAPVRVAPLPQQRYKKPTLLQQSYQKSAPPARIPDYRQFIKALGLDSAESVTTASPFVSKQHSNRFEDFFHPASFENQITHHPSQQTRVVPVQNYDPYKQAILNKNYRDHKTHEPHNNPDKERDDSLEEIEVERSKEERGPISVHEYPLDIPTRPIYPGEGKWAKPGVKHRPFISKQQYSSLEDDSSEERPDGYDIFLDAKKLFNEQESVFQKGIRGPRIFGSGESSEEERDGEKRQETNNDDTFIPTQLYAQVRRTNERLRLPRKKSEPRLKEEINDSQVHTIYSEEGYEDSAYDHAGHEKNAEVDEAKRHRKKKLKKKFPKKYYRESYVPPESHEDESSEDSSAAIENASSESSSEKQDVGRAESQDQAVSSSKMPKSKQSQTTDTTLDYLTSGEIELLKIPRNDTTQHSTQQTTQYTTQETTQETEQLTTQEMTQHMPNLTTQFHEYMTTPPISMRAKRDLEAHKLYQLQLDADSLKNEEYARLKRFTDDFHHIEADTSFLDDLLYSPPKRKRKRKPRRKYPYYRSDKLPENSPLRYAENLKNVPEKRGGNMAFYDQADKKGECEEVRNVDPIPERIKNVDETEGGPSEVADLPEVPRITLDDTIGCFKAKYFGSNPLDSPFFKEGIQAPQPIFKELVQVKKVVDPAENASSSEVHAKVMKDNEIKESSEPAFTQKITKISKLAPTVNVKGDTNGNEPVKISSEPPVSTKRYDKPEKTPLVQNTATTDPSVPTLITTPSYTVKLKPKHIYDQIHLLDYLPSRNNESLEMVTTEMSVTETVSFEKVTTDSANETTTETTNKKRRRLKAPSQQAQVASDNTETVDRRKPKLLVVAIDDRADTEVPSNVEATTVVVQDASTTEATEDKPQAQALRKVRRRKRPRPQNDQFGIFDINDFLPPPLPSQYTFVDQASPKSKQKPLVSEVQYKEEIKPSEQLNVFEDVINNIRNTPTEATQTAQGAKTGEVQVDPPVVRRVKKVKPTSSRKIRIKNPVTDTQTAGSENLENVGDGVDVDDPAIFYPEFGQRKPTRSVESSYTVNQNVPSWKNHKVYKTGQNIVPLSQTSKTPVSEEPALVRITPIPNIDNEEQVTDVLGLVPPDNWQYKTIYPIDNPEKRSNETVLNTYPVVGMKPPPANQRTLTYLDFNAKAPVRRVQHRVAKRSALRSRYTEIKRNNNKNKTADEETDDYTPRRPTSFHYDVEKAQIVYDRKSNHENKNSDTPLITTTTASTTNFPTSTKKPEMNWFEYIKILKNSDKYIEIPEEQPTEKQDLSTTTAPVVPASQGSTSAPQYLDLIAKLKQSSNYKVIEDPKELKKKASTTTALPHMEAEVEAEESIDYKHVQNSPGVQLFQMQEDNASDLPVTENKIKNYTPKTIIDTSKYKTIERSRVSTSTEDVTIADRRVDSTNPMEESEAQLSTPEISSQAPTTTTATSTTTTTKSRRVLNSKLSGNLRSPSSPRTTAKPRRPTNLYTRTTTLKPRTTTTVVAETTKTFFRRRFNRTRIQTSPEKFQQELESEAKNKTLKRRHQPEIPINHKPIFTPLVKPTQSTPSNISANNHVNIQVTPRTVTAEILYQTENLTSNMKHHEMKPRKIVDDKILKHEKKGNETTTSPPQRHQITPRKISDKAKPWISRNDQAKADDVEIIKSYDKTKKHGGNYKADEEAQEAQSILLNRANDVLKTQRLNFRRRMSTTTPIPKTESTLLISDSPKDDIEIISNYDEDKKTGGGYKSEEDAIKEEDDVEEDIADDTAAPRVSDVPFPNKIRRTTKRKATVADAAYSQKLVKPKEEVEVIANYDETKKHGGNLKSDEETEIIGSTEGTLPKTSNYPIPNKIKRNFRRKGAPSAPPVRITSSTTKSPKLEVDVIAPFDESKKHGGNYKPSELQSASNLSEETTIPKVTELSENNKAKRHFRRKVSNTGDNKNSVPQKPKEEVEIVNDYDRNKKHGGNYQPESTIVETVTEVATAAPEEDVEIIGSINEEKKHGGNYKPENEEGDAELSIAAEETAESSDANKVRRHFRRRVSVGGEVPERNTVTQNPKEDIEVVKDYDKSKKHGGNFKADEEVNESVVVSSLEVENADSSNEQKSAEISDANKARRHFRRKVTVGGEITQRNTVPQNPKEDIEVIKDYDKSKKHGGNFKADEEANESIVAPKLEEVILDSSNDQKTDEISDANKARRHFRRRVTVGGEVPQKNTVPQNPKEDIEVIKDYDKSKKHGGNFKADEEANESVVASKLEEDILDSSNEQKTDEISDTNKARRHYRRRVTVGGEVPQKNTVTQNPKEDIEVMKDYDKSKKHGGNFKADEEVDESAVAPKLEVEIVESFDEQKKHGGNYKPADEDTDYGEIPIVAAETALPKIATIPEGNSVRKHYRKRVSVSYDEINKVISVENPKEDVDVFKDYDESQRHGGNYRAEDEIMETTPTVTTTTTTVATTKGTVAPTNSARRQTRRKTTTRGPTTKRSVHRTTTTTTTTTAAPPSTPSTTTKSIEELTTVVLETSEMPPPSSVKPIRSQRVKSRRRNNIVASQMVGGRPNDVEIIKDYDKTKHHGGNYRWEETTTHRGRIRQNRTENNKTGDVEVFAKYNKTQRTGGNYRRQRPTPTTTTTTTPATTTTTESLPETSVLPTAFELENSDEIEQLTDAVPKPFSYYSDSKLPDNVNHLDDSSSKEKEEEETSVEDYLVGEESRVSSTTRKPLFVKDPKKRKYFYAPVK